MYVSAHQRLNTAPLASGRYTPDGASPEDIRRNAILQAGTPQPIRGLPVAFVRSALFSVSDVANSDRTEEAKARTLVKVPLHLGPMPSLVKGTKAVAKLTYSGLRLGQPHALAWQALISIALENKIDLAHDVEIKTSRRALLETLGLRGDNFKSRKIILRLLEEIQTGVIELDTDRHVFRGVLISSTLYDKKTGVLIVTIPSKVIALLCDEVASIDLKRKVELGRDALTLWLHDFLSSQANSEWQLTWTVKDLYKMSGSCALLRKFRADLKAAAEALTKGSLPLLTSWSLEDDCLTYKKIKTRVVLLPPKAQEVAKIQSFHAMNVTAAQLQRARVLL